MQTTRKHSSVRNRTKQDAERIGNKKGQTKKCSAIYAGHDFLKKPFAPVMGQRLAGIGNPTTVEVAFYTSVQNFCKLYGLHFEKSAQPYPLNIADDFRWIEEAFNKKQTGLDLIILNDRRHKTCLATVKSYKTGGYLFYIPVRPLLLMLQARKTKKQGLLILSVFAYLHKVADVPYFTDDYLSGTYEMIKDWYEEDPSEFEEEQSKVKSEFREMEHFGKKLLKSIQHPYHLKQFQKRLQKFTPCTPDDEKLRAVCSRFLWLYKTLPSRSLSNSFYPRILHPNEDDRILPDQYISFFWNGEGIIYQQLIESVNVSFQDMGIMDEPLAFQYFDTPQEKEHHDLLFETFFFDSIHELCELLN